MSKQVDAARPAHTPGPWGRNIKPASKYITIYAGRNTHVAHLATGGLTEREIENNCNLIASAPQLLAALLEASRALTELDPLGEHHDAKTIDVALSKALRDE